MVIFFPEKQDLTFHTNFSIGDILLEMSKPVFKEKYFDMSSAENFTQSAKR